ncbi:MAG: SHOCT domain-containing protein [Alphaproteobacteria bacterium]|nr:SHOCT domain-containing protein [Alphaproteobacteria bacterium]
METHCRLSLGLFGVLILSAPPAMAEARMLPPAVGANYAFDCATPSGENFTESYMVQEVDGDLVTMAVSRGDKSYRYSKPYYLAGTTLNASQTVDGSTSTMSLPNMSAMADLEVGKSFSAYVDERRPSKSYEWNYTVSITGTDVLYVPDIGDVEVVVLNEDRWTNLFSSKMVAQYSPQHRFPVSWSYADSNGRGVECLMRSAEGYGAGAQLVAAARPAAQAQTQAAPKPRTQAFQPTPPPANLQVPPQRVQAPARSQSQTQAPAQTQVAAAPPATARPTPGPSSRSTQERLAKLQELRDLELITAEEFEQRRKEIQAERDESGIPGELARVNRLYQQNQLTRDDFVRRRAEILAKIAPDQMSPKKALVLLNTLLDQQLISPNEFAGKRELMLDSL